MPVAKRPMRFRCSRMPSPLWKYRQCRTSRLKRRCQKCREKQRYYLFHPAARPSTSMYVCPSKPPIEGNCRLSAHVRTLLRGNAGSYFPVMTCALALTAAVALASNTCFGQQTVRIRAASAPNTSSGRPSGQPEVLPAVAPSAITLADAESWALANNPSISRASALVGAARGNWVQVGLPPNPTAGYEGQQLGSGGRAQQQGITFSQESCAVASCDLIARSRNKSWSAPSRNSPHNSSEC